VGAAAVFAIAPTVYPHSRRFANRVESRSSPEERRTFR
jgi:hypothetical protein